MSRRIRQLLLAGAIFVAPMAIAQSEKRGPDKDPTAMAEARTAKMTETLSLTPDQVEKVRAINLRHAERMKAIHQQQDKEQKKAAMKQLREWRQGEFKSVLTAEQITRMEELHKEKKAGHHGKGKGMDKSKGERMERGKPAAK